MGFKRTTEGRVYFEGDDEPSVARPVDYRALAKGAQTSSQPPAQGPAAQATQFQILTLLKALNDKLKVSQAERARMRSELDAYKKVIEDLGGKAEKGEKAWAEIEQKLARADKGAGSKAERAEQMATDTLKELQETRKLLLELEDKTEKTDKIAFALQRQIGQTKTLGDEIVKKQLSYDELLKRVDMAEERHEQIAAKVEETVSQQSKMLRQIEKVAEDRQRFMRKIERIEETVIQTRDALTAKAMVLLTEQGAVRADGVSQAGPSVAEQLRENAPRGVVFTPAWRRPAMQAGAVAALLAFGILAGWGVSEIEQARQSSLESFQTSENKLAQPPAMDETSSAPVSSENADVTAQGSAGQFSENSEKDGPAAPAAQEVTAKPVNNDIGAIDVNDPKKLAEMLDKSPDGVAAALNNIEPQSAPPKDAPPVKAAAPAPVPVKQKAAAPAEVISSPLEQPADKEDLARLMRPDSNLPAAAQAIEKEAFAGVPEAQHDLAAVYTAGQGGVKQDYARAAFWFRQAADHGIANARYNLGVLYHQGLGVKPDVKEAIRWYQSAAQLGHPEAEYNLGIAYIEGVGVGYDPNKAADNFQKAAKQGITEAAYNLGLIYENGLLGKAEPDQALKWYKTAADQGSPEAKEALNELAKTLKIKVEDVNRVADEVKGVEKRTDAAPANNERALIAQIQEYLMKAGFYPGPADGAPNEITADAIRSYQSAKNIPADGKVSQSLLEHLEEDNR